MQITGKKKTKNKMLKIRYMGIHNKYGLKKNPSERPNIQFE